MPSPAATRHPWTSTRPRTSPPWTRSTSPSSACSAREPSTVGTLSDAPPNIYIDESGKFTGYDNELLRAIAAKLGLEVEFKATGFASLLSQVQNKQFDLGSSSISTTDARRKTVGFTNGYDFGYMAVVAKKDDNVKGFKDLTKDTRIARRPGHGAG